MTRIVSERNLIPEGCELFEFSDVDGLAAAVERALQN
jgi:hypothetical protein